VAGAARVRVSFQIDADGLLAVTAREQIAGIESHVEVKPSYGLTDIQIASMLQQAIDASLPDMQLRTLREAQIDARRLLDATEAALAGDSSLLAPDELTAVQQAMFQVGDALETHASVDLLKAASTGLASVTGEFASRRMNASIRKALAGRNLNSLA